MEETKTIALLFLYYGGIAVGIILTLTFAIVAVRWAFAVAV
jgi:hypothetical protein